MSDLRPGTRQPADDTRLRLTRIGWRVVSRDGHQLGEVAGFDRGRVIVTGPSAASQTLSIPEQYVGREDEGDMQATLVLDAREAAVLTDRPDSAM